MRNLAKFRKVLRVWKTISSLGQVVQRFALSLSQGDYELRMAVVDELFFDHLITKSLEYFLHIRNLYPMVKISSKPCCYLLSRFTILSSRFPEPSLVIMGSELKTLKQRPFEISVI